MESIWKHSSTHKAPVGEQVLVKDKYGYLHLAEAEQPTLLGQEFHFYNDGGCSWSEDLTCWWLLPPPAPEEIDNV